MRHFAILGSEGILRRVGGCRYEEAIRVFGEEVHVKLCRPAHRRVVLCELFLVTAEEEALPNVLTHPRTAIVCRAPNRALTGSGKAPDIGNDVRDPAARIVVGLCGCLARLDQRLHVVEQRNVTRCEVGGLGKPVVHLDIDVEVVVAIPRRRVFLCPDSLEVCREPAGPAGADEEVAPELEEECRERWIQLGLAGGDAIRERKVGAAWAEVELDAAHQGCVVSRMPCLKRCVAQLCRAGENRLEVIHSLLLEIGSRGEEEEGLITCSDGA